MIDRTHELSVVRQCQILELARSTAYYTPKPTSAEDVVLMRRMDELHLEYPFAGSRMLRDLLRNEGQPVGRKRIRRLMKRMDIEALYRRPTTSRRHPAHPIYPYLLRRLSIQRPNHVWATDITYIPMRRGFIYLVAIVDWYSRRVLAWRLSNTLTANSPGSSRRTAFASAWTAKAAGGTTSSSSASGGPSSTTRCISKPTSRFLTPRRAWGSSSPSTTAGDRIRHLPARRRT